VRHEHDDHADAAFLQSTLNIPDPARNGRQGPHHPGGRSERVDRQEPIT